MPDRPPPDLAAPDLAALERAARDLLPEGCAVASADPRQIHPLWPGEAPAGAVPARLAEFSAGRAAARAALQALGLKPAPIPAGPDRAPLWPEGVHGTITHSRSACLAALRRGTGGIGLDLEPLRPLPAEIWDTVLLPEERREVEQAADPGLAALLVFSAKEAAYKAQFAFSRQLFGFETLTVRIAGAAFTARFRFSAYPFRPGDEIQGGWAQLEGHILTAAAL